MIFQASKAFYRFLCFQLHCDVTPSRLYRIHSRCSLFSWRPLNVPDCAPLLQLARNKGQNRVRKDSAKLVSLTEELKQIIKEEEMLQEYAKVVARFRDDLNRKLCLKLTPEILYSIPIPNERVKLGEVATIIPQNSVHPTGAQPTSQILIDLSGRPDLAVTAKAAVVNFLSQGSDISGSKRGNTAARGHLVEDVDHTQFTVQLRTVVTGDTRNELARRGREMLTRTKKEMDKVYQKFSKSVSAMKSLSEDKKRTANEYLKTSVKEQHAIAERVWEAKEQEIQ